MDLSKISMIASECDDNDIKVLKSKIETIKMINRKE